MRVKSRKPPAENLMTSDLRLLLEVGRGADDRIGDQMRQVRGHRQHLVVMVGAHRDDPHAGVRHSRPTFDHRSDAVPGGGVRMHKRPSNSSANPASGPGMFGAGDRMAGDEMDAGRKMRLQVADHRLLGRADIGHDRARPQPRRDRRPISA